MDQGLCGQRDVNRERETIDKHGCFFACVCGCLCFCVCVCGWMGGVCCCVLLWLVVGGWVVGGLWLWLWFL